MTLYPSHGATLTSFIQCHRTMLWGYLRALGCDDALADDLSQDVFVAAWQKLNSRDFEVRSDAEAAIWLRRSAHFAWLNWHRREGRRSRLLETHALLLDHAEAERAWQSATLGSDPEGLSKALAECLPNLETRAQVALERRYHANLSDKDIAALLNTSVSNVSTILQRARQALKRCIESKLRREP